MWTKDEFAADIAEATEWFRKERMEEPLDDYVESFDRAQASLENLFEDTLDLFRAKERAGEFLLDTQQKKVFRYLAGPPISEDDLKTLVGSSIARTTLRDQPDVVERVVDIVLAGLDSRRFPWVREGREPTDAEVQAAIKSTAALIAHQETATLRRNAAKRAQEALTARALEAAGLKHVEITSKNIRTLSDGPQRGEYSREKNLAGRKADLIAGLYDGRVMPIECKVSNSGTNSVKRILNDAAAKAEKWRNELGNSQVIPVAVLSGVFKVHNLEEAQRRGLSLYWAHRLGDLTNWISQNRTTP